MCTNTILKDLHTFPQKLQTFNIILLSYIKELTIILVYFFYILIQNETEEDLNQAIAILLCSLPYGSPYLVNEYFERVNTCINAYSNTAVMHPAVIAALMGEVKMTGQSPVDINIENFTKK